MLQFAAMVSMFSLSKGNKIKTTETNKTLFWCVTLFSRRHLLDYSLLTELLKWCHNAGQYEEFFLLPSCMI